VEVEKKAGNRDRKFRGKQKAGTGLEIDILSLFPFSLLPGPASEPG
jgi:hypothetical protein